MGKFAGRAGQPPRFAADSALGASVARRGGLVMLGLFGVCLGDVVPVWVRRCALRALACAKDEHVPARAAR